MTRGSSAVWLLALSLMGTVALGLAPTPLFAPTGVASATAHIDTPEHASGGTTGGHSAFVLELEETSAGEAGEDFEEGQLTVMAACPLQALGTLHGATSLRRVIAPQPRPEKGIAGTIASPRCRGPPHIG